MIANLGGNAELISGLTGPQSMPQQSLASAHSAEVWGLLGTCVTFLVALVALLYKRINDDIKDVASDVETVAASGDALDKAMQDRCLTINTELTQIKTNMAQFATHQVMTSTEVSDLEAELKRVGDRLLKMETEHALCFGAYQRERQRQ